MSGIFGSSQWMYSSGKEFYEYKIDQSVRFNDGDSPLLYKTPSSTDSQKKWTVAFWMKRCQIGGDTNGILGVGTGDGAEDTIIFTANRIRFRYSTGSDFTPDVMLRDPSAWYHVVIAADTTQGTAKERLKFYLNGVHLDIDTFGHYSDHNVYPSQNHNFRINSAAQHYIGEFPRVSDHFDGYFADWHFIDGIQYAASDFGETKSGIWVAKEFTGSYGTAGYRLDFADSSNLGNDVSGNNNDYSVANLTASDQVLDSPTNNFATLNSVTYAGSGGITLSEGNLKAVTSVSGTSRTYSTFARSDGKWYWENYHVTANQGFSGIASTLTTSDGGANIYVVYYSTGQKYVNGSASSYGASYTDGDIISTALDLDGGTVTFYKNGVSQGAISLPSNDGDWQTFITDGSSSHSTTSILNFGQDDTFAGTISATGNTDGNGQGVFKYSVPSGYLAWCSANLPDPAIDPLEDETPEDYFNTVLYTGNGVNSPNSNIITGVGFQPDLIWIKARSSAYEHHLQDVVTGLGNFRRTNNTAADAITGGGDVSSVTSDGFNVSYANNRTNGSGTTFVAWNWLAGNGTSSNTDGTITSTVSANTKSGCSIISYTGNGTAGATVGHGLDSAPEMMWVKSRDQGTSGYTGQWDVYHKDARSGSNKGYLVLNSNDSVNTTATNVFTADPTSSVFELGTAAAVNTNNDDFICYAFHSVEGFSKVGSYTGNNTNDNAFVNLGFRPAWVMCKSYSSGGNHFDWVIYDNVRTPYNPIDAVLEANQSQAEVTGTGRGLQLDFLSNGFKIRNSYAEVGSNVSYIYIAFAEQPFKYANAR
jgi:hypothetical protein